MDSLDILRHPVITAFSRPSFVLKDVSKKLRIKVKELRLSVGAPDASDTAIRYGAIAQGVAYLLEFLDENVSLTVSDGAVSVDADFLSGKFGISADIIVGIRIISVLIIGISFVIKLISRKIKK